MPRNISFMLTTKQLLDGSKTVTRRIGWKFLKAGDQLMACEKCQGLGKGGKLNRYGLIQVKSVVREPLNHIQQDDCIKEGFPEMEPGEFVEFFCHTHRGCKPKTHITRIEFEKLF